MTSSGTAEPVILDAMEMTSDPDLGARFAESAHQILAGLVRGGAALGWVEPPSRHEVTELLGDVVTALQAGDRALGYWLRYARPTHRPHADLKKIAVDVAAHGRGVGRALTAALIADARRAGIEVLTLDARGDNSNALHLYRSVGFTRSRVRTSLQTGLAAGCHATWQPGGGADRYGGPRLRGFCHGAGVTGGRGSCIQAATTTVATVSRPAPGSPGVPRCGRGASLHTLGRAHCLRRAAAPP